MVTTEVKSKILAAMNDARRNFGSSDSKFAVTLGISAAQYSRVKSGDTDRVLSDANWLSIARRLQVELTPAAGWKVAKTPVYEYIYTQLTHCQAHSTSGLLCDLPDIGKTFTAKQYIRENKNAIYIDCSLVKSKQRMVRQIAKEFGLGHTGKYNDVFEDLIFFLKGTSESALIILDEAGDLYYEAFLELKALWNATERSCGWYMMGADGLRHKIELAIEHRRVGYAELFSRFGSRYGRITPATAEELKQFRMLQGKMVVDVNYLADMSTPGPDYMRQVLARTDMSLRRIYTEIKKVSIA